MKKKKKNSKKNNDHKQTGIPGLKPGERIPHVCNHAGVCCWEGDVQYKGYKIHGAGLLPFDVWRMITSPVQPLRKFGIHTTGQLLDEEKGLTFFGLSPDAKMPMCGLKRSLYKGIPGAAKHCPFIVWEGSMQVSDIEEKILLSGKLPGPNFWLIDGKPRFSCGLGPAKPVQCDSFPVGRYIGRHEGSETRVQLVCSLEACNKCMPSLVGKNQGPAAVDYIQQSEISSYLRFTSQYMSVLEEINRRNTPDEIRMAVARALFDFDSLILEGLSIQGYSTEEAADRLIETRLKLQEQGPGSLTAAAHALIQRYVNQVNGIQGAGS